jgi:hypothetical protein
MPILQPSIRFLADGFGRNENQLVFITTSGIVFPSAFAFTLPLERETLHPVRMIRSRLLALIKPFRLKERRAEGGRFIFL